MQYLFGTFIFSNGLILRADHLTVVASNSFYLFCSTELLNQLYFHNAQWRCHIEVSVHNIVSHRSLNKESDPHCCAINRLFP